MFSVFVFIGKMKRRGNTGFENKEPITLKILFICSSCVQDQTFFLRESDGKSEKWQ